MWMATHVLFRRSKITVVRPGRGNDVPSGWKPVEFQVMTAHARSPEASQWSWSKSKVKSRRFGQVREHADAGDYAAAGIGCLKMPCRGMLGIDVVGEFRRTLTFVLSTEVSTSL